VKSHTKKPCRKKPYQQQTKNMKSSRAALAMLLSSSATAFTTTTTASRSAFLGRSAAAFRMMRRSHIVVPHQSKNSAVPRRLSGTGLSMIFGNFFSGGAFDTKIDYSALDFPGPELAVAAEEGKVLTTSPSKPELAVASFAGGCFWGVELAFQRVPGVEYTAVGYTQGEETYPT
jgi:hypothetical protein